MLYNYINIYVINYNIHLVTKLYTKDLRQSTTKLYTLKGR